MTPELALQIAEEHIKADRAGPAERLARLVLADDPDNLRAIEVLAGAAYIAGRLEDARDLFAKVIAASPAPSSLQCYRLGATLRHLMHIEQSIQWLDRAVTLDPNFADAHLVLALSLLTLDQYERGFEEFEWRWKSTLLNTQRIGFSQPQWTGQDLSGKTLLVWAEQGLGDVIQVARYARLLVDRGATVVVGCQKPLARLMSAAEGVSVATSQFDQTPAFHYQISSFSLMRAFRTTYDTIPADIPYIRADPELVAQWKDRLAGDPARLKVGLVWAGTTTNPTDLIRSLPVTGLAPLVGIPDASFYSLQIDERGAGVASAPPGLGLKHVGHLLSDFADTAGLLMNLDLLISVDTAPVHLAGALGRPVWVLLAHMNDWRWGMNRTDNRWYPTALLFRQRRRGDWNQVMNDVAAELRKR